MTKRDRKSVTGKTVTLNKLNDPRLGCLRVLFKEIMQQIPLERADELAHGYLAGKKILLIIQPSSHGKHCETAFVTGLIDKVAFSDPVLAPITGPVN